MEAGAALGVHLNTTFDKVLVPRRVIFDYENRQSVELEQPYYNQRLYAKSSQEVVLYADDELNGSSLANDIAESNSLTAREQLSQRQQSAQRVGGDTGSQSKQQLRASADVQMPGEAGGSDPLEARRINSLWEIQRPNPFKSQLP